MNGYGTIIKKIEGEEIWIKDTELSDCTLIVIILTIGIFTIICSTIFSMMLISDGSEIIIAGSVGLVIVVSSLMTGFGVKQVPAYKIYIVNDPASNNKIIRKTTPEEDQKAICKAVQDLTLIAIEIARKKRELEKIAQTCK